MALDIVVLGDVEDITDRQRDTLAALTARGTSRPGLASLLPTVRQRLVCFPAPNPAQPFWQQIEPLLEQIGRERDQVRTWACCMQCIRVRVNCLARAVLLPLFWHAGKTACPPALHRVIVLG